MTMLLLRVIVTLIACWIVKCDLLDLYVQHMDETMRTMLYKNKRHPMDPVTRRIKRSLEEDEPLLRIGNFKKQRLDVDENWSKQWKAKSKIPYKNDALDYPNKREENPNPDQHEIFPTQNSKHFEKTSTVLENAVENLRSNVSQDPIIEEQEDTSEDELTSVENQSNIEELIVEALEPEEGLSEENLKDSEEMENEDNSQFEIISENDRINPKPFIDPSFKRPPKPWGSRAPKKYFPEKVKDTRGAKSHVKDETATRSRRSANQGVNESISNVRPWKFTRYEKLDENGDVILEWDPSDEEVVIFKVSAKTLGYVGIGFNEKVNMIGADILLAWVDDHTGAVNLLDSHGVMDQNTAPILDASEDVQVLSGSQNETHTIVTFVRKWETCDPQDHQLTGTIRVLWALHETDPELNTAMWHGTRRGGRPLRLKTAAAHSPPRERRNIRHWDVKLNQFEVDNTDTIYWCKIFKTSLLRKKHHMIGYTPLVEKVNEELVHHVILYECASTAPILGEHARIAGARCYSPTMPRAWDSCLQPVLAWARGSEGEWMPEHVGIPIAEHGESSYYMLEVHYNNPKKKKVIDSSGIRLHLTSKLRPQEAGILVAGVAVSPLHVIPPQQKEYATAGYCTPNCTSEMFPKDGINIVSVVLHSHLAGRRLSLKHIRQGKELPKIVQDNHYDFNYQQSYTLEKEVKVLPGDELVAECIYRTLDRTKPTLGGYAASQEMCLTFVMHYPRTPLAGCYSMTPVKELFNTLGVYSFRGMTMESLEKLFLANGSDLISPTIDQQQLPGYPAMRSTDEIDKTVVKEAESALKAMREHTDENEDDNVFTRLIIDEPEEFRDRTMAEHMMALPWTEDLLTRSIENNLYHGKHMTFCRKRDDRLAIEAAVQNFPNFTALPETNDTICSEIKFTSGSSGDPHIHLINLVTIVVISIVML